MQGIAFKIWLVLLFALVSGPVMAATPVSGVRVDVRRENAKEWQAQYLLPKPVVAVQFRRGIDLQREKVWQLLNPELQFDRVDEQVRIRARDNKPFAAFTVRFPQQSSILNRDYTFHVSNADGSLLLFTGQLYIDLISDVKAVVANQPLPFVPHLLLLTPLPNEAVLISGQQQHGRLSWLDVSGEGAYAYFGNGKRQETINGYVILDAAAPAWARQLITEFVPALFAQYQARFGFSLAKKPTVTLSYQPDPNYSNLSGGLLADVIQVSIQGDYYAQQNAATVRDLRELIAHEVAHFWQWGVLTKDSDADHRQAWVHEGGADATAARVMLELGLLSSQQYHDENVAALNGCVQSLQGIAMADAHKKGRGKAYYQCGEALIFILEQHMLARGQRFTVFELWQLMAASQRQLSTSSNAQLFQNALSLSQVAPELQTAMRQFVEQVHEDSLTDMKTLISAANLRAEMDIRQAPASAHFEQARRWMAALMATDCDGSISFYSNRGENQEARFEIEGMSHCRQLKSAQTIRSLAGMGVTVAELDEKLRRRCATDGVIPATSDTTEFLLACPAQLPAPMQWLVLPQIDGRVADR